MQSYKDLDVEEVHDGERVVGLKNDRNQPLCGYIKDDNTPCRSHILVDGKGLCPAHREGGREEMARRGKKGGKDKPSQDTGPPGLSPNDLPPLVDHDAAETWLEVIGRAVTSGRLGDRDANAGIRAVEAWLKTRGEKLTTEVVEDLKEEIDRLKEELAGRESASPW